MQFAVRLFVRPKLDFNCLIKCFRGFVVKAGVGTTRVAAVDTWWKVCLDWRLGVPVQTIVGVLLLPENASGRATEETAVGMVPTGWSKRFCDC